MCLARFHLLTCVALVLLLSACALAPSERSEQHFVPALDLRAVELAREGLSYLSEDRYIDAESRLRQALYLAPNAQNLRLNLAVALEGNAQFDQAAQILEPLARVIDKKPPTDIFFRLAHLAAAQEHWDVAEKRYQQILDSAEETRDFVTAAKAANGLFTISRRLGRQRETLCCAYLLCVLKNDLPSAYEYARLLVQYDQPQAAESFISAFATDHNLLQEPRVTHLHSLISLARGQLKEAFESESQLLREGNLDTSLMREARLVRLAASTDPAVAATLDDKAKEQLKLIWEEIGPSVDLGNKEVQTWPGRMVEAIEGLIAATAEDS